MLRPFRSRVLVLGLALTTGLAGPISALAHGQAHDHDGAAHSVADQALSRHAASKDSHDHSDATAGLANARTIESADLEAGDHPHPSVGAALTTKAASTFVVVVAVHLILPVARVVAVALPKPETALQFRAEAAHAPPPRLRAPPFLLG